MDVADPIRAVRDWVAALGIDGLDRPEWLWLLAPALLAWLWAAQTREPALAWSAFGVARQAGASGLDWLRALSTILRGGALFALCVVLAEPVGVHRMPPEPGHGLDLVLAVDASGSMRALDAEIEGEWRPRLDLAREVVSRFAEQRAEAGDRVALVVFGESAFTQCPLTSDGRLLASALSRVEAGVAGEATALGDALSLAVKRALGAARGNAAGELLAGRVVVLLTDGRNNAGTVSVELATALAAAEGIRVHTVAIGSASKEVAMAPADGTVDLRLHFERHEVDAEALARIAAATGGRFFAAQRAVDLEVVYAEIDSLERIARPMPPRIHRSSRPEPLLAIAGGLLFVELTAARIARRRLT